MENVEIENKDNNVEVNLDEKKKKKNRSIFLELIRFVLTGILCTLIDFGIQYGLLFAFANNLSLIDNWGEYVSFSIAVIVGFIISTIVNFILSRVFVFKNVDEKINTKSQKAFWIYFWLGFGGLILGLGLEILGLVICKYAFNINISIDITKVSFSELFSEGGLPLWAFVIVFAIKTVITLIYNYLTRKFIIFKAPKNEEKIAKEIEKKENQEIVTVQKSETKVEEIKQQEKLLSEESLKRILHEEFRSFYGKGQLTIHQKEGEDIFETEFQKFLEEHPSYRK